MSWYDYAAIVFALLLALNAESDARAATRASVASYLFVQFTMFEEPQWIRGYELRTVFGLSVYRSLKDLHEDGIIERKETPGGEKRERFEDVLWRWKEPESDEHEEQPGAV